MRRESARASNDQFGEIICPRTSLKSPRGEARQITHDFPAIERENGNNAMQCNERIVGSRRLDAVSLKERVTSENNRDGETYYPCERQTCYDVSRFYCTSLMIPTIRCVFKVRVAEGCTRDRSCIHERSCEREETKKKEMGEWENRGEKGGGVKSKRNEIEQRKEGRKRKMENNRGARRREDRQTR